MYPKMRCYVLHGKHDIRLETREVPQISEDMVLIKMRRMGICGTDVGYFGRGPVGRFGRVSPFILGHEGAGEVVDVGSNVKGLAAGSRVAIDPSQPCYHCRYCMTGRYNLCRQMRYLGSAGTIPPSDGLFADYLAFPARNCHPLPDELSYGEAALTEPLSVAIHAIKRAGDISGFSVLVTGGGPIGQLVLVVARAFGASKIALSEMVNTRRQFALDNGADQALDPTDESMMERARDFTDGGFDFAFEAAGAAAALTQAIDLVRPGGTIVQIGGLPGDVPMPINKIMSKELQYFGSFRFANVFQQAIHLAASKRIDLKPLITNTLPLAEFHTAMDQARARAGVVKVQIKSDRQ